MGMHVNIEMGLGLAMSLCGKYELGVNNDDGGKYIPRDFVCSSKVLRSHEVHAQLDCVLQM